MKSFKLSVEFFPPKTALGIEHLKEAALQIIPHEPHFFSVTFGAGGSTRDGTIETVKLLQQKTSISVAPHLSCIGFDAKDIEQVLRQYKAMGVKRIVALRGDLPSGMGQQGQIKYASDLVALIRKKLGDDFYIEVAAYPEIHPQALTVHDDVLNLKRKLDAGANGAITQYFYNADAYFYYLDECAAQGIHIPIIPGIMPITQFSKLLRFSELCGAEIPRWIRKRLEAYGDDLESIKKFGTEIVYQLCQRLIEGGAPGLHFYSLNKADATIALLKLLEPESSYQNIFHLEKGRVN